jgi:hypothetical protein
LSLHRSQLFEVKATPTGVRFIEGGDAQRWAALDAIRAVLMRFIVRPVSGSGEMGLAHERPALLDYGRMPEKPTGGLNRISCSHSGRSGTFVPRVGMQGSD